MIIVMEPKADSTQLNRVIERLKELGFEAHLSQGVERTIIGAVGDKTKINLQFLEALPGVEKVVPILQPFKLASKEFLHHKSEVSVGDVVFGGKKLVMIAGPCAVESEEQIIEAAQMVKAGGASMLRGGAFKPRTSPYSFQGLEEEGLKLLAEARAETGLPVISEVVNPRDVELVSQYVDMLQIGARNMQNFTLLREVGLAEKPVLLKRGMSATIEEWLMAAEYIISAGNFNVVLCERGIRTFETATRNTLDLSAVPLIRELSHLPVIVDPSHGTGKKRLVTAMARAGIAAGADGIMVEVHPKPEKALSDGPQSLRPEEFSELIREVTKVAVALDRIM
ncbi:MAG: 3-deoxy-7-phosphoheptulonate synthase [Limnochordia bacterium]|nr:3-deoxy-7-phosphoheptulonate synthase [Limnochordia bacterium]